MRHDTAGVAEGPKPGKPPAPGQRHQKWLRFAKRNPLFLFVLRAKMGSFGKFSQGA